VTSIFKLLDSFLIQTSKPWTVEEEYNLREKVSGEDFRGGENVHNFVGELAGDLGRGNVWRYLEGNIWGGNVGI